MYLNKLWHQRAVRWATAIILIIGIKIFSLSAVRVEAFYTSKFYFFFSKFLRIIFGWIPFSVGDILYLLAGGWLLWKLIKTIKLLVTRRLTRVIIFRRLPKLIFSLIFIYLVFNIFWGLNYNRKGVGSQLQLSEMRYDTTDVLMLQDILLKKVNETKTVLLNQNTFYPGKKELFERAKRSYNDAEKIYSFLKYRNISVKPSLYNWWGNYLGFTGYYNPFTGEAQVNTTVPKFLQPYISTHEIAHQLGYAKEDEANFVGYLAAVNSRDTLFHYSAYLDLFMYANREVFYFDSVASKKSRALLVPAAQKDIEEWRRFSLAHRSFVEPVISWMYGNFLKLNQQPQGLRSYNEVIATLIAYFKKYGRI